jgi:hypothetical protein
MDFDKIWIASLNQKQFSGAFNFGRINPLELLVYVTLRQSFKKFLKTEKDHTTNGLTDGTKHRSHYIL